MPHLDVAHGAWSRTRATLEAQYCALLRLVADVRQHARIRHHSAPSARVLDGHALVTSDDGASQHQVQHALENCGAALPSPLFPSGLLEGLHDGYVGHGDPLRLSRDAVNDPESDCVQLVG